MSTYYVTLRVKPKDQTATPPDEWDEQFVVESLDPNDDYDIVVEGTEKKPELEYPYDAGMQMAYDTLCDREVADPAEIKRRMDAYDGDFWMDYFGPIIDQIERDLFPNED